MGHRFAEIAFTPSVRDLQRQKGSGAGYAAMVEGHDSNQRLAEAEAAFIAARDSFYIASVGETGWPYVQHRGGPTGFVKIINETTLGFADYSGNRQYITTGHLRKENRVALFFMDYPKRIRLKLLGRIELVDLDEAEMIARVEDDDYRARVERGMIIRVEGFDWNCPRRLSQDWRRDHPPGAGTPTDFGRIEWVTLPLIGSRYSGFQLLFPEPPAAPNETLLFAPPDGFSTRRKPLLGKTHTKCDDRRSPHLRSGRKSEL